MLLRRLKHSLRNLFDYFFRTLLVAESRGGCSVSGNSRLVLTVEACLRVYARSHPSELRARQHLPKNRQTASAPLPESLNPALSTAACSGGDARPYMGRCMLRYSSRSLPSEACQSDSGRTGVTGSRGRKEHRLDPSR